MYHMHIPLERTEDNIPRRQWEPFILNDPEILRRDDEKGEAIWCGICPLDEENLPVQVNSRKNRPYNSYRWLEHKRTKRHQSFLQETTCNSEVILNESSKAATPSEGHDEPFAVQCLGVWPSGAFVREFQQYGRYDDFPIEFHESREPIEGEVQVFASNCTRMFKMPHDKRTRKIQSCDTCLCIARDKKLKKRFAKMIRVRRALKCLEIEREGTTLNESDQLFCRSFISDSTKHNLAKQKLIERIKKLLLLHGQGHDTSKNKSPRPACVEHQLQDARRESSVPYCQGILGACSCPNEALRHYGVIKILHLLGDPKVLAVQKHIKLGFDFKTGDRRVFSVECTGRLETTTTIQGCAACSKIKASKEWHEYVEQLQMTKQAMRYTLDGTLSEEKQNALKNFVQCSDQVNLGGHMYKQIKQKIQFYVDINGWFQSNQQKLHDANIPPPPFKQMD